MEKFQAIQPSLLLAPYIKQYWFITVDDVAQGSQRFVPAGSMGLVFNRASRTYSSAENGLLPTSYLFGQSTRYTNLTFGTLDLIIVVFQPIGAKAFFKMSMNGLNEQSVSIDALSDRRIMELEERLMATADNQTCVLQIEQFLLKRIGRSEDYNFNRLAPVIKSIHDGENELSKLSQTTCLSYKQFKRIFADYAGLNPKEFLQIARFSKTLRMLQTHPQRSLSELAVECGYYDKSHLIREIKLFSGYTPIELLSKCEPYSDYMSLFQSFFVDTSH